MGDEDRDDLSGCPCGGTHSPPTRIRRWREANPGLPGKVIEAQWAGKATRSDETGNWEVEYAGDCKRPLRVRQHALKPDLRAAYIVRCRKCATCRRAMRNYWGYAAMNQTVLSAAKGLRTWFGTLTLKPELQEILLLRAMKRSKEPSAEWWKVVECEERYKLVCNEFLREVQKYWKRLRNEGHSFKYIAVFERHKSGLPHAHFLLHELEQPIRKSVLRAKWEELGFFSASLVGGCARNAAAPENAAWYVVKYLSKTNQTRVRASKGYVPEMRPKVHSPKDVEEKTRTERGTTRTCEARDVRRQTTHDAWTRGVGGASAARDEQSLAVKEEANEQHTNERTGTPRKPGAEEGAETISGAAEGRFLRGSSVGCVSRLLPP